MTRSILTLLLSAAMLVCQADDLSTLSHGIGISCGPQPVTADAMRCLHGQNNSVISLTISGWAPASDYNVSALVQSVRNAKAAGLTVWVSLFFDETQPSTDKTVVPTLDAIQAAGLSDSVERVWVFVEGAPIIWNEGKQAREFMWDAIDSIGASFSVGVATNNIQWSWITGHLRMSSNNLQWKQIAALPLWYDSGTASEDFSDFATYPQLHRPRGPWDQAAAKTYSSAGNATSCGVQDEVRRLVYSKSQVQH
jgi:hypothetical protein